MKCFFCLVVVIVNEAVTTNDRPFPISSLSAVCQPAYPLLLQMAGIRALRLVVATEDPFCARAIAKQGMTPIRKAYKSRIQTAQDAVDVGV